MQRTKDEFREIKVTSAGNLDYMFDQEHYFRFYIKNGNDFCNMRCEFPDGEKAKFLKLVHAHDWQLMRILQTSIFFSLSAEYAHDDMEDRDLLVIRVLSNPALAKQAIRDNNSDLKILATIYPNLAEIIDQPSVQEACDQMRQHLGAARHEANKANQEPNRFQLLSNPLRKCSVKSQNELDHLFATPEVFNASIRNGSDYYKFYCLFPRGWEAKYAKLIQAENWQLERILDAKTFFDLVVEHNSLQLPDRDEMLVRVLKSPALTRQALQFNERYFKEIAEVHPRFAEIFRQTTVEQVCERALALGLVEREMESPFPALK